MMYAKALINEITAAGKRFDGELSSVYFGGGTPSIMDVSHMFRIMTAVRESFDLAPGAEITLEANPGTLGSKDRVKRGKLIAYRSMGINRLSMGVQSMDNDRLRFLGRIHTAEDVARDVAMAKEIGFDNINLDLIFSVPGETAEDALSDARRIIELGPDHISCYSLQLEEGTPFYAMAERGEISEVSDEEDRDTYHRIIDLLRNSGYEHYEISNFALTSSFRRAADRVIIKAPGFGEKDSLTVPPSPYRSRHNSLYWNMDDYIGTGLGASGFEKGIRYRNTTDMERYLEKYAAPADTDAADSELPREEEHVNSGYDNISEAVFTGLRRREGITYREALNACRRIEGYGAGADTYQCTSPEILPDISSDTAQSMTDEEAFWRIYNDARAEAERFAREGLLVIDSDGLRLTEAGIDISNSIMALFV